MINERPCDAAMLSYRDMTGLLLQTCTSVQSLVATLMLNARNCSPASNASAMLVTKATVYFVKVNRCSDIFLCTSSSSCVTCNVPKVNMRCVRLHVFLHVFMLNTQFSLYVSLQFTQDFLWMLFLPLGISSHQMYRNTWM